MLLAVLVAGASPALAQSRVAGGQNFTLIVLPDGSVWSFGYNGQGQLGHGATSQTPTTTPKQIEGLSGVQAVAAGVNFGLALTTTGTVFAWGSNAFGQLGTGDATWHASPVQSELSNIVAIAAGEWHAVALTATGDVLTWGQNTYGQLGNGGTGTSHTPAVVMSDVMAIGAGRLHTLVVKNDGSAWAWGQNTSGQLGNDAFTNGATTAPVQMIGVTTAVAVYGGGEHSVVRLADGTLMATGENFNAELGDDTTVTPRLTAVAVAGLTGIQHVAVGLRHNLAIDAAGTLWVWGDGVYGGLGTGAQTDVRRAVSLSSPTGVAWIAAGWTHAIAVDAGGVVST